MRSGHRPDDADDRYARLEVWARERIPEMKEVEYRWSGQVMEPVDGVAFIGRSPGDAKNVFLATGDSGMGMTHGTIAGILISDLIQGARTPGRRSTTRAGSRSGPLPSSRART